MASLAKAPAGHHDSVCPDPSAHTRSHKGATLPEKAAGAALHNNHAAHTDSRPNSTYPLDADGRLSSAGAAASLKYARAQDLPSFPSVGIDKETSGLSAASLAHANQKPFEHWKPGRIDHANQAAMLAKDYKMAPLWQPEASAAGSKAAMLAHTGPGRDWWQPQPSKNGSSAAEMAFRNKGLAPQAYAGVGEKEKRNALLAASASVKGRKRSDSVPATTPLYPDQHNAGHNAFSAATIAADRPSSRSMEASRITHLNKNITPKMFTDRPPIAWEEEEKRHQNALQASAISMAKQMYAIQKVDDDGNITLDHNQAAARAAHNKQPTTGPTDLQTQALQYLSLQDAAQKLATERLSKIHHPDENAAFRSYYGYPERSRTSRLSMAGRSKRASSEGASTRDIDSDDEEQAQRIRRKQSQFNKSLAQVDRQRDDDRKKLMALAEKRVHAQMTAMDRRVYEDTGKMSSALHEEWDAKARAKAAAASEARMANHGKVDVGGGKMMDRADIEAIAAARVQPTLDQINATAETQRAHDETVKMETDHRKRQAAMEKQREAESKAEQKRIRAMEKEEIKIKKDQEKQAARTEKELEKARKAEEKRLVQDEKRRSKEAKELAAAGSATGAAHLFKRRSSVPATTTPHDEHVEASSVEESDDDFSDVDPVAEAAIHDVPAEVPVVPQPDVVAASSEDHHVVDEKNSASPTKPKRFSSLLSKFKLKSKDNKHASKDETATVSTNGRAAAPIAASGALASHHHHDDNDDDDDDDVDAATAAAPHLNHPDAASEISSLSSDGEADRFETALDRGRTRSRTSVSTTDFEEARDTLAPPPQPAFTSVKVPESPTRESRFHEEV